MSDDDKKPGNILVNPSDYAERLSKLEIDQHRSHIDRIEEHLGHRLRLGGAITYINEDGIHVIEDRDGIRPFPEGSEFPSAPQNPELQIRELAFQHGVTSERNELDSWCEAVTANAGDDIRSDEVEQLIIGLGRIEAVDGVELTRLHARYLEETLNT